MRTPNIRDFNAILPCIILIQDGSKYEYITYTILSDKFKLKYTRLDYLRYDQLTSFLKS